MRVFFFKSLFMSSPDAADSSHIEYIKLNHCKRRVNDFMLVSENAL